jgi:transketolase
MLDRKQLANAIRALSMDAVQKANSGHPGMPMGMADIAEVLWNSFLKHNPKNPHWLDRDRFILSNGHGCMLQYALLHLSGYDLTIEDIKAFRQLHSKTPGHPEYGQTPGIETSTGPLGQGIANAVGMAIAERNLAAQFNRPSHTIVDHYTYVFLGDGCLMEGISHEVCSLAGTLGLGKLIAFWDDNGISIDGQVEGWFTDNTPERFRAYGWHVIADVDGHDPKAIREAILHARETHDKPSLICCKTTIAYGAPHLSGTAEAHGAPLGEKEIAAAREFLAWDYPPFVIPETIYAAWDATKKGEKAEAEWQERFLAYQKEYPALAAEWLRRIRHELPVDWSAKTTAFIANTQQKGENLATRKASQNALNGFGSFLPELLGGSADLAGSNLTLWSGSQALTKKSPAGNYLYYGVREFGMSAIMNGIAIHGGFIPYGGTFLTFTDYARNAVRMAALMKQRVIFVYTHDSIGLGEDGPTHQPIEHTAMLRMTPNLSVWRPCDAVESAVAWRSAIERLSGPTALLFSRQTLPHQQRNETTLANINRGGYILVECKGTPDAIIIATGSEVQLAVAAAKQLGEQGKQIRVVSMPSADVFARQDKIYQATVLPPTITNRIAIEAGTSTYWYQYVGLTGKIIGIDRYGESAPANDLFKFFGFTIENVIQTINELILSY